MLLISKYNLLGPFGVAHMYSFRTDLLVLDNQSGASSLRKTDSWQSLVAQSASSGAPTFTFL